MAIPDRAEAVFQKREIIDRLFTIWIQHPELRLGQLIINYYGNSNDGYHVEDYEWIRKLEEFYKGEDEEDRRWLRNALRSSASTIKGAEAAVRYMKENPTAEDKWLESFKELSASGQMDEIMQAAYHTCFGDCETCRNQDSKDIDDGMGNHWCEYCPTCRQKTREVVRPGKIQCSNCGELL